MILSHKISQIPHACHFTTQALAHSISWPWSNDKNMCTISIGGNHRIEKHNHTYHHVTVFWETNFLQKQLHFGSKDGGTAVKHIWYASKKLKDISILKHFWERTLGGPNKLRTLNRMQTNLKSTLILTQRYVIPGTLHLSHPKSRSFSCQTCCRPDPLLWNFGQRSQEPPGMDRDTHRAK